jgi:hypothetical protein
MPCRSRRCPQMPPVRHAILQHGAPAADRCVTGDLAPCASSFDRERLTLAAFSASHHQTDSGMPRDAVFRQRIGTAEAVPARVADLAVGECAARTRSSSQQHAVQRLGGGDQIGAVLGEDDALDQASTAVVLDAGEIVRAGPVGGLRAPELPRCSLPGDSDCGQEAWMISKSKLRTRFSYCTASTARRLTVMPSARGSGL